jgi:nucleotide-binding universal stress UspA family protein
MLVPIGNTPQDEEVLRYVCGLAAQSVQRVLVATVIDDSGLEAPVMAAEMDRARVRLKEWTRPLAEGCSMDIETRVITGDAIQCILALAQQADIDVICCGTEGRSVVDTLFSGSISQELFVSGKMRTMTVRYDLLDAAEDPADLGIDFAKRLVVPTDFSASATRAWLSALERPAEVIGDLVALHVVSEGDDAEMRNADIMLGGLLGIARESGVNARAEIVIGNDQPQAVLEYLEKIQATGVITGQHGRGALRRAILGGLSLRLLREAPCPVVVQP